MNNQSPSVTPGIITNYTSSQEFENTLTSATSQFSLPQTTVDYLNHKANKWKTKQDIKAKKELERNAFNIDKLVNEAKKRLKNHINEITYRHLSEHFKLFPRDRILIVAGGAGGSPFGIHDPKPTPFLSLGCSPNNIAVAMVGGGGGGSCNIGSNGAIGYLGRPAIDG